MKLSEKTKINWLLIKLYGEIAYNFIKLLWLIVLLFALINFMWNAKVVRIIDTKNIDESIYIIWPGIINLF
jgi:hypothetical protein